MIASLQNASWSYKKFSVYNTTNKLYVHAFSYMAKNAITHTINHATAVE